MSQTTLTGETTQVKTPLTKLTPTERIVYDVVLYAGRGLSYEDVSKRLTLRKEKGEIQETGNKLRALRQYGWIFSHVGPDGLTRFYPTENKKHGPM